MFTPTGDIFFLGEFLMTLGGTANNRFVKLYSLDVNHQVPVCLDSLNDLPDDRRYAAGAVLRGEGREQLNSLLPSVAGTFWNQQPMQRY